MDLRKFKLYSMILMERNSYKIKCIMDGFFSPKINSIDKLRRISNPECVVQQCCSYSAKLEYGFEC